MSPLGAHRWWSGSPSKEGVPHGADWGAECSGGDRRLGVPGLKTHRRPFSGQSGPSCQGLKNGLRASLSPVASRPPCKYSLTERTICLGTAASGFPYLRVSTDRQGQSGLWLEAQRKAVLDFLNGGNWKLAEEFVEVESGKRNNRPQLAAALAACKRLKTKLVIAKSPAPDPAAAS